MIGEFVNNHFGSNSSDKLGNIINRKTPMIARTKTQRAGIITDCILPLSTPHLYIHGISAHIKKDVLVKAIK